MSDPQAGHVRTVRKLPKRLATRLALLDVELTERCNNRCIHCGINLPENDARARALEMTTAQVVGLLGQATGLGCLQVRFTGGEPLLRPDFPDLYLAARKLGLKVLIFTNGRLISEELADLLARIPPLVTMEITVYGMRPESYEAVTRAPGSFAEFRRGVDRLLERRVPFVVKTAYLAPSRSDVEEFEAWSKTIPWMTRPPQYAMFLDLRGRRDDPAKNRLIESLRTTPEEGLALMTRDPGRFRKDMGEFAAKFMRPGGDLLFGCGAGRSICVDAYGRLQPCLVLRAPEMAEDLFPESGPAPSLAEAAARFERLAGLRTDNPEYLRRCAVCFLKGLCEQCPAKSWAENGTLDTPVEYLCRVAHAQARWLGWLKEDEWSWEVKDGAARIAAAERAG